MSGLPEKIEHEREAIVQLAREHRVCEIAYCDKLASFFVFAIEVESGYETLNYVRLTRLLGDLLGEPVVVVEQRNLSDEPGERLRDKAQRL